MTPLHKPVKRRSQTSIRDRSKYRNLIISIHPGGYIGLRLEGCRTTETLDFGSAWSIAVKQRVAKARADKKAARKAAKF